MKRLLIYDASPKSAKTFVGKAWAFWATANGLRFDDVLKVVSWDDCFAKLQHLQVLGRSYDGVQFWGHGSPGRVSIAGKSADDAEGGVSGFWKLLGKLTRSDSTVWLRICSFAAGEKGKAACNQASQEIGCRFLAHTHVIGEMACQSGCRAVKWPELKAEWPDDEGRVVGKRGEEDEDGKKGSAPWIPNTASALAIGEPWWAKNK